MRIGIDILEIDRVEKLLAGGEEALSHLLYPDEYINLPASTIGGAIAAKESLVKCGVIKLGDWHAVRIHHDETGRPLVLDANEVRREDVDLSISHTSTTVVAVAIWQINL